MAIKSREIAYQINYSTFKAVVDPSIQVYWSRYSSGAYDIWIGTDRYFAHCSVQAQEDILDFEASYKNALYEVPGEDDAYVLADIANGNPLVLPKDANGRPIIQVTGSSNQPLAIHPPASNLIRTDYREVTSKTETQVLSYTVPADKTFSISFLGGSYFAPSSLSMAIRVKVDGAVKYMMLASQYCNVEMGLPLPVLLATAGQVVTVTIETQMPRGQAWVMFSGVEA